MPDFIWIQNVIFPLVGMGMATFFGWQIIRSVNRHLDRRHQMKGGGDIEELKREVERLRSMVDGGDDVVARLADVEERLDFTERVLAQQQPLKSLKAPDENDVVTPA